MTSWTSVTPHFLSMKAPIVKTGQPSPFDLVCLRQPQYVAPFEYDGDSLMLNRGGRSVTSRLDARADARVEQMEEPKLA
jgi:hypothetical protein